MSLRLCLAIFLYTALHSQAAPPPAPHPVEKKLHALVIPKVEFDEASFDEAIGFIFSKAREIDPETDKEKKGIDFVFSGDPADFGVAKISLKLEDTPIFDTLTAVVKAFEFEFFVNDEGAVVLHPKGKRPPPIRVLPDTLNAAQKHTLTTMEKTIIPSVAFDEATLEEALEYLRRQSIEHSPFKDPARQGIGARFQGEWVLAEDPTALTLRLTKVPLDKALDFVCQLSNMRWTIDKGGKLVMRFAKAK